MKVIARRTLRKFWNVYPDSEQPLKAWYEKTIKANWRTRQDISHDFGQRVKILKNNRARFSIKGGNYRLVIALDYKRQWVFIKFIGSHAEYDRINAETINLRI